MRDHRLPSATITAGLSALPIAGAVTFGPHLPDLPKLLLLVTAFAVAVGVARMLTRPAAPLAAQRRESGGRALRYTAVDIWALDRFCSSIGEVKRAMPELGAVCIDLRHVPTLDASSLVTLDLAVRRLTKKGISVEIQGCTGRLAVELTRRGLLV